MNNIYLKNNKSDLLYFFMSLVVIFTPIFKIFLNSIPGNYFFTIEVHFIPFLALIFLIILAIQLYIDKFLIKKKKCNNINWFAYPCLYFFIAFIIFMIIANLLRSDFLLSFFGISNRNGVLYQEYEAAIHFISYAVIFIVGFKIKSNDLKILLLRSFILVGIFIGILALVDPYGTSIPSFYYDGLRYSANFVNSNHYGYYLVFCILISSMLSISFKNIFQKIFYYFATVFFIVILLLNGSFGSSLAVFVSFIFLPFYYFIFNKKWDLLSFIYIITFLILALFVNNFKFYRDLIKTILEIFAMLNIQTSNESIKNESIKDEISVEEISSKQYEYGTNRIGLWKTSLEKIKIYPFFGTGFGKFVYSGKEWALPHNEYINYALTSGIPTLLFYLTAIVFMYIQMFKQKNKNNSLVIVLGIAIFGYLFSAFFGNTMPHTTIYFALFIGMFISSLEPINIKQKSSNI